MIDVLGTFDHLQPSAAATHAPRPSPPTKLSVSSRRASLQPPTNKLNAFPENLHDYMRGALEMTEGGGGGGQRK